MKQHKNYSCSDEQHFKCENSALCHLCDGVRLYKNSQEERAEKLRQRELNKKAEKNAAFRTHKHEKKEGMAFEKAVANKWNAGYKESKDVDSLFKQSNKKTKIQKPRIQIDEPNKTSEADSKTDVYIPPVSFGSQSKKVIPKQPVVDAKRQVNSGAMWYSKGDIKTEHYLFECKERGTINARGEKTISVPKSWLTKQEQEAFQENRPYWALPFRYKNDESIYIIKSFDQEIEMYQELRSLREEVDRLKENGKD